MCSGDGKRAPGSIANCLFNKANSTESNGVILKPYLNSHYVIFSSLAIPERGSISSVVSRTRAQNVAFSFAFFSRGYSSLPLERNQACPSKVSYTLRKSTKRNLAVDWVVKSRVELRRGAVGVRDMQMSPITGKHRRIAPLDPVLRSPSLHLLQGLVFHLLTPSAHPALSFSLSLSRPDKRLLAQRFPFSARSSTAVRGLSFFPGPARAPATTTKPSLSPGVGGAD